MRRFILAVMFCALCAISSAQEFSVKRFRVAAPTHDHVRILDAEWAKKAKNVSRYTWPLYRGTPLPKFEEWRREWLEDRESDFLTPDLDTLWQDTARWKRDDFLIELVFGQDGRVFTVIFQMDEAVYNRLPENWLKNTFNRLMEEKIDAVRYWDFSRTGKKGTGRIYFSLLDLKTGDIPCQYYQSSPSKEDLVRNTAYFQAFATKGVVVKSGGAHYRLTFSEDRRYLLLRNMKNRDKTLGLRPKYIPGLSSVSDSIHEIIYDLFSPAERDRIVGEKMDEELWVVLRLNKKLGVREVVFQFPVHELFWMNILPERYCAIEKQIKKRVRVTEYYKTDYYKKLRKDIVVQDVWVPVSQGEFREIREDRAAHRSKPRTLMEIMKSKD